MILPVKFSVKMVAKVPVAELALLNLGHAAQVKVVLFVLKYPKQGTRTKGKGSILLTSSFK
jgi:hypothetical protein